MFVICSDRSFPGINFPSVLFRSCIVDEERIEFEQIPWPSRWSGQAYQRPFITCGIIFPLIEGESWHLCRLDASSLNMISLLDTTYYVSLIVFRFIKSQDYGTTGCIGKCRICFPKGFWDSPEEWFRTDIEWFRTDLELCSVDLENLETICWSIVAAKVDRLIMMEGAFTE